MSRKAPGIANGRRLRLMPLNILGGGPIIVDVDEEERNRQKRRLERAQAIVEAEALKKAQEQALAMVQAQAQQAEEEERKKQEKQEQSPGQAPVAEAAVPVAVPTSPVQSTATVRIRESKDELQGTRTIEFRIDDKNTQGTPDSKKGDAGDGTDTAEADGTDKAAERKQGRGKAKKKAKKAAWVTYLDETSSNSSSHENADAEADADDDDTDVSTRADDGLEDHIRHLATKLCIGNDGDKPAKKDTEPDASASKHQGRQRRRSSHSRQRHQMHFFSDIDKARGTREVRLEAYSKKGDKAREEERKKRLLDEKSNEAAAVEAKLDETSPSKDDAPRFLPAPPNSQTGQDLAINDPGDEHDAYRDHFHCSRSHRKHYVDTLPPPPGRPAVDFYGHPIPSYASPYVPYPAYPPAYVPMPPPPPLYPPYHAQPPYAAYGPPPPPPEHTPYYYDHHRRRAPDHQYAPAPCAPYAPTPPSPRSPARHFSSNSVRSGPGGGHPQRDGPSGHQQSRRPKGALPYSGDDNVAAWHDPDAAGQAAGDGDTAWNKAAGWEATPGMTNNTSKHAKGTKGQENNKGSNDLDDWGICWDQGNNGNNDDAGKHKDKGKDAEKTDQDNGNSGWVNWDADEKKSSKNESGWPGWNTDNNNNSNKGWAGWGSESKKGDAKSGNSNSGWVGWDTGSNGSKVKSQQGKTRNNSNNGDNDNIWGLGGDGAEDNGNGAGDYAGDYGGSGDANDLWSGGNNMATMVEEDDNATTGTGHKNAAQLPGAWPPSDGNETQKQQTASSQDGIISW